MLAFTVENGRAPRTQEMELESKGSYLKKPVTRRLLELEEPTLIREAKTQLEDKGNRFATMNLFGELPEVVAGIESQRGGGIHESPGMGSLEKLVSLALSLVPSDRPTPYEYALLSAAVYKDREAHEVKQGIRQGPVANRIELPEGWKVLQISNEYQEKQEGYFGVAYQNENTKHIVIAHRGTNPSDLDNLFTDVQGIVLNRRTGPQEYAWEFTKDIIKDFSDYTFSSTGHSLGAWLAQICVFYGEAKYGTGKINAVTFDDPGCQEMMEKRQRESERYKRIQIDDLDIVNYLSVPNPINTFNNHAGTSYRLYSKQLGDLSISNPTNYTLESHKLENLIACFDSETGMPREQKYVEQFPVYGRSMLDPTVNLLQEMSWQNFFANICDAASHLLKAGREKYRNYDPQNLHRRNFPSLVRRFLADKKVLPPEELPSHPSLHKDKMVMLLETLLQSHRVNLDGTIEITNNQITAIDFRKVLTFLLSGPSLKKKESFPEATKVGREEDPAKFSIEKLLQRLHDKDKNVKLTCERELSRRFQQYEKELTGNLIYIDDAREDLLKLVYAAVNGARNVYVRAMDLLIRSLEDDPCTPEGAYSMIKVYGTLHKKMDEVMRSLQARVPAMDTLTVERLTRAFDLALKRVNMYRLRGLTTVQFREGEGAIKKEAIWEEVRKLGKLTESQSEGSGFFNWVWKHTIGYYWIGPERVEMPSSDNWEVKHNLNSIAEGIKFLRMDEADFETAGKNAWGLTKKTLLTGKKLVELFSSSATKEIPAALSNFVSTAGWGTFLSAGKAILSNANNVIDAAENAAELVGDGYTKARDTFNNFKTPENWYLKTLLLWNSMKSSEESVFFIAWLGASIRESLDEKAWDWHYERIAFLRYIIKQLASERVVQAVAMNTLRVYFEPEVWPTLSDHIKVKLFVVAREFQLFEDLELKGFEGYGDLENRAESTAQLIEAKGCKNYWKSIKPAICEYTKPVVKFSGRKALLNRIEREFQKLSTDGPRIVVLSGLGGMGKTELVNKFIDEHAHQYNLVWTFYAESEETLDQSYYALAQKLRFVHEKEAAVDAKGIRAIVNGYLQDLNHHGWLLYFDNAEGDISALKQKFPQQGGQILVTSRPTEQSKWGEEVSVIPIEKFARKESIQLLKKLIVDECKRDEDSMNDLAKTLDDWPLLLTQVGNFINEEKVSGIDIRRYLVDYLDTEQMDVLKSEKANVGYHHTLPMILNITMDHIEKESPDAVKILKLCAYFNADGIPLKWLKDELKEKKQLTEGLDLDRALNNAISPLINYSLLNREEPQPQEKTFNMHRMVQSVIRDNLTEEKRKEIIGEVLRLVEEKFSLYDCNDPETWKIGRECLLHANSITNHVSKHYTDFNELEDSEREIPEQMGVLFDAMGTYVIRQGNAFQAIEYYEKALEMKKAFLGDSHLSVADTLNNLGLAWSSLGENKKAIEYYEKALEMKKAFLGDSHPSVADTLNNLGAAWSDLGENKKAIEYYEKALEMKKAFLGESHPSVASTLNNLGTAWSSLGEKKKAIEYYEKALEMTKSFFGESHPSVALTLNNLGLAWSDLGEKKKAIEYYEKALEMTKSFFGESHPSVADTLHNLGLAWSDLGENKKAIEYYEKALEMTKSFLGESHPSVANTLTGLGVVWSDLGENKKAIEYYEKALEICTDSNEMSQMEVCSRLLAFHQKERV